MTTRPAVSISADDDDRRQTTRRVYALPPVERANVGRLFVGYICELEVETHRGAGAETVTVAVEGVASNVASTADGYLLVVSRLDNLHDLSHLDAYSLATVRSIRTLRPF